MLIHTVYGEFPELLEDISINNLFKTPPIKFVNIVNIRNSRNI